MRIGRKLTALASVVAVTAFVVAMPRSADASEKDEVRRDEVLRAVETGQIRSLADILNAVRSKLPGEVAGVEVERKKGRWLYEFRVVDSKGRLFDVYVDARSGEIERIKEK
jgi:uncharacterized membrane protein YkoI